MTNVITLKNITSRLSSTVKSLANQRENIQALIVFGLQYYNGEIPSAKGEPVEPGNPLYLTVVFNALSGLSTIREQTLQAFIQTHANVIWGRNTKGEYVFKPKGEFKCEMPTTNWWEHDKAGKARADFDFNKTVTLFLKKMTDNAGKLDDRQAAAVKAMADAYAESMTGLSNKGQDAIELPAASNE